MVESFHIILADDHHLFREGMKKLIHDMPGIEVVGEAKNVRELFDLLKKSVPDLVILDISMPDRSGIEACREIRILYAETKVLILTMHKSKEYLYQAISAGANGYLLKEDSHEGLQRAIETMREGGTYITPNLAGALAGDVTYLLSGRDKLAPKLVTAREREVLKRVAEGKSNAEVADLLCISVRTVESHRASLMKKLNLKNTAELVKYAIQDGLV